MRLSSSASRLCSVAVRCMCSIAHSSHVPVACGSWHGSDLLIVCRSTISGHHWLLQQHQSKTLCVQAAEQQQYKARQSSQCAF